MAGPNTWREHIFRYTAGMSGLNPNEDEEKQGTFAPGQPKGSGRPWAAWVNRGCRLPRFGRACSGAAARPALQEHHVDLL